MGGGLFEAIDGTTRMRGLLFTSIKRASLRGVACTNQC